MIILGQKATTIFSLESLSSRPQEMRLTRIFPNPCLLCQLLNLMLNLISSLHFLQNSYLEHKIMFKNDLIEQQFGHFVYQSTVVVVTSRIIHARSLLLKSPLLTNTNQKKYLSVLGKFFCYLKREQLCSTCKKFVKVKSTAAD